MSFLYSIFLLLYRLGIAIVARRSAKAKQWLVGRRHWRTSIAAALQPGEKRIWIHASSLGEFEQGRPLIDELRTQYPNYKIVLTFFSPSGYQNTRQYTGADYIFYLPMDGRSASSQFIDLIQPQLAIFIKYEFWYYYLTALHQRRIPTLLVAAAFRPRQAFFQWHGAFFRRMLRCFTQLHVQDQSSATLLQGIGLTNVYITGDTRFDRVSTIAAKVRPMPELDIFTNGCKLIISGSTWPADEQLLKQFVDNLPDGWKVIIAPHEIHDDHLDDLCRLFVNKCLCYSELETLAYPALKQVLIIDNIGMLASLYSLASIAYVGGGFQKGGIHNVLEPAVFSVPIVIGPVYTKFVEAVKLTQAGVVFPVSTPAQGVERLHQLVASPQQRITIAHQAQTFMQNHVGATKHIMAQIKLNNWLD